MKLSDLLEFAKGEARINRSDYFEPGYATADYVKAWVNDRARRDRQRREVMRAFPGRVKSAASETLIPGRYYGTRLIIAKDGEINYIPGQYAAVEIWPAVLDYLNATNDQEG